MPDEQTKNTVSPFKRLLKNRNFKLLWLGEGISLLGDQFYMIALPWLVLQMTGDALAVGGVLAVAGIPRAVFMLFGGVLTDRISPRKVMLWSNILRMLIVVVLTVIVFLGVVHLWMLYALALIFGIVDAFFFPAQSTIVPQLVEKDNLQTGNSIIQGTAQISRFVGPILAGAIIGLFASSGDSVIVGGEVVPDLGGLAFAFGFDALTFLVSALTLGMIKSKSADQQSESAAKKDSVLKSIQAGMSYVWNDKLIRTFFLVSTAINFFVNGPILVGIPVLADTRFVEGAAAFGTIMSSYGGGNLLGILLAAAIPKPPAKKFGVTILLVISILGIGVALLGLTTSIIFAAIVGLIMGIANGYVGILFITWLQTRTPQAMLGRMMSLMMFAAMGLNPISMALSGFFIDIHINGTFIVAGVVMTLIVLFAAMNKNVREMEFEENASG